MLESGRGNEAVCRCYLSSSFPGQGAYGSPCPGNIDVNRKDATDVSMLEFQYPLLKGTPAFPVGQKFDPKHYLAYRHCRNEHLPSFES